MDWLRFSNSPKKLVELDPSLVDELTQFTGDEYQIKQSNGLISQSVDFSDQFDVHGVKNFKYADEE